MLNQLKSILQDVSSSASGRPSTGSDGSIMPPGYSSVRAPIMGQNEGRQLETIQSLLGKGAEQSLQGLLNNGKSPIDTNAINQFQREIMPQLTQGAAHHNMLGASGLAGAQADATSRLSEALAANKYNALGDLLNKYGQFSKMSPYEYSAYDSGGIDWGSITDALSKDYSKMGKWNKYGTLGGKLIGSYWGAPGSQILGAGMGYLGELLDSLLSKDDTGVQENG